MKPSLKPLEDLQKDYFESEDITDPAVSEHAGNLSVLKTSVCMLLQEQRNKLGIALKNVSRDLRISETYLQAIEEANIKMLPERVYILGFIRSYARYLNLDSDDIINRFKTEILGDVIPTNYSMPKPVIGNSLPNRWLIWMTTIIVILGIAIGWIYYALDTPSLTKSQSIPAVIKNNISEQTRDSGSSDSTSVYTMSQANDSLNASDQVFKDNPNASQASMGKNIHQNNVGAQAGLLPSEGTIQFRFTALSWVEIRDESGTTIVNRNFKAGEIYNIQFKPGLIFSTGNAGGIEIVLPSSQIFNLGKQGEVLHNINLDSNRFQPNF